jgi:Tfp pilus assembly protein PilV
MNIPAMHLSRLDPRPARRSVAAFTLLEVLIAMGIFFVAAFAILGLTTQNLRAARSLKQPTVDITMAVYDLMLTNRLEEGSDAGDFGDLYPDASWTRDISQVATNGLFQVDVTVFRPGGETKRSLLLYRPDSIQRLGLRRP